VFLVVNLEGKNMSKVIFSFFVLGIFLAVVRADDLPPEKQSTYQKQQAAISALIEKQKAIKAKKAEDKRRAELKKVGIDPDKKVVIEPRLVWPFHVGDVGKLDTGMKIFQIIDDNNALVEIYPHDTMAYLKYPEIVWLKMPTKGDVDGKEYSTSNLKLEVIGTKKYEATLGSRTVFVLKIKGVESK
jgi:hypothetical protein